MVALKLGYEGCTQLWVDNQYIDENCNNNSNDDTKLMENISNNREQLELNYRLMQLKEVDINGGAKMLTLNKVQGDIDKLNTYEFKKMFMRDKM